MTPFPIAHDPPPPRSIPDLRYPDKTVSERAAARFSLADKTAIGESIKQHPMPMDFCV